MKLFQEFKMKNFPSSKEIKKLSERIEKFEGTKASPQNPTPLEKFRFELQQKFVIYKLRNKCTQKELADILGID
jgi:hypothetical protein